MRYTNPRLYVLTYFLLRPDSTTSSLRFFEHVQNSTTSSMSMETISRPCRFLLRSYYVLTASTQFLEDVVGTWLVWRGFNQYVIYTFRVKIQNTTNVKYSDVVLEAWPWPRGALRPNFMVLALASKVQALASTLALRAALTIFGITLTFK